MHATKAAILFGRSQFSEAVALYLQTADEFSAVGNISDSIRMVMFAAGYAEQAGDLEAGVTLFESAFARALAAQQEGDYAGQLVGPIGNKFAYFLDKLGIPRMPPPSAPSWRLSNRAKLAID